MTNNEWLYVRTYISKPSKLRFQFLVPIIIIFLMISILIIINYKYGIYIYNNINEILYTLRYNYIKDDYIYKETEYTQHSSEENRRDYTY